MKTAERPLADTRHNLDLFREKLAEHRIDRCVIVTGSFRSGSSYLCQLLKANGLPKPGVEGFSKYFDTRYSAPRVPFGDLLDQTFSTTQDGLFAVKLMWPHRNNLACALGLGRQDSAEFAALFPDCRWINIVRRDKVAQAISFHKAKQSKRWHVFTKGEEPEVDYDMSSIRNALAELAIHDDLWADFHARADTRPFEVVYEDLLADVPSRLDELLAYLGPTHRLTDAPPVLSVRLKQQRNAQSADFTERFLDDCYAAGA